MRIPIIAGNWKMHNTVNQAKQLVAELIPVVKNTNVEVVVCPTFTALYAVSEVIRGTNIVLGAQNLYWEEKGAFTGEIAPGMLKEVGCKYVLVGHSERRQFFGETNVTVNQKLHAAFKAGLLPILCVGETLKQREGGITETVIKEQVTDGLKALPVMQVKSMVIAYEPVWAIGTGRTASSEDANTVCSFIRNTVGDILGKEAADAVRIQYGGSVKPENAAELMSKSDIDGALVGGASLEASKFGKIVNY